MRASAVIVAFAAVSDVAFVVIIARSATLGIASILVFVVRSGVTTALVDIGLDTGDFIMANALAEGSGQVFSARVCPT